MDPDATLEQLRDLAAQVMVDGKLGSYADDLAQHVVALDNWIRSGGFLPKDWQR